MLWRGIGQGVGQIGRGVGQWGLDASSHRQGNRGALYMEDHAKCHEDPSRFVVPTGWCAQIFEGALPS